AAGTTPCGPCCCQKGIACQNPSTGQCGCPAGTTPCGTACCTKGIACASPSNSTCAGSTAACLQGTPCGSTCCPPGQTCCGGTCITCATGRCAGTSCDCTPAPIVCSKTVACGVEKSCGASGSGCQCWL